MKKFLSLLILLLTLVLHVNAKTIVDMSGREVYVKDNITKAYSASPPMMALLYALAPEMMIGVNYKFLDVEKKFMLKETQELPVIGGFFGDGQQANIEKVVALKPDVIFAWDRTINPINDFTKTIEKFNIPVVQIRQNTLEDSIMSINLMGEILGRDNRAKTLSDYAIKSLLDVRLSVNTLPRDNKKIRVFLANGDDGLVTECEGDMQSEIITLAGGVNVHRCDTSQSTKREKITLEKLYTYNPDVIFVREKSFFDTLDNTSNWRNLKAFKENKIYLTPSSPFAWLNRPPSFMRFLGLPWMHSKLYPEHFKFNEYEEIKKFYKLFLHVELSDNEVSKLLKGE
ncbi:MAG: ABC transporter substrate-binding protein [Campylobacteraceae bacterium]